MSAEEQSGQSESSARNRRRRTPLRQFDTSVPSPCIGVCWLNEESGLCEGCLRSGDEIRDWLIMSREDKLSLLEVLAARVQSQQE